MTVENSQIYESNSKEKLTSRNSCHCDEYLVKTGPRRLVSYVFTVRKTNIWLSRVLKKYAPAVIPTFLKA